MAGIDKTYTRSYKEYKEFVDWAKNKEVVFHYGRKTAKYLVSMHIYNWEETDFDGDELPIMNTPIWLDKYLYDNCPCKFVLDRLNEVYPEGYLDKITIGNIPENFKQNRKIKIRKHRYNSLPLTNKGLKPKTEWLIFGYDYVYNEDLKAFVHDDSHFPSYINVMSCSTVKSMIRRLRKMYLPSGVEFVLNGGHAGEIFKVKIK